MESLPEITDEDNVMMDLNYIKRSSTLVNDALQKGLDVLHLENGDIEITEVKTVTYKYIWDESARKFIRAANNTRQKRRQKLDDAKVMTSSETSELEMA